jgi:hypothetical protein
MPPPETWGLDMQRREFNMLLGGARRRHGRSRRSYGVDLVDTCRQALPRPGGNMTGVMQYEPSVVGKWLSMLLKDIAPRLARVGFVINPKTAPFYSYYLRPAESLSPSLGIELVPTLVETPTEIGRAIESFARVPNGGLLVPPDITTFAHRDLIIALAARHSLPAVYSFRLFVLAGGLMIVDVKIAVLRPSPLFKSLQESSDPRSIASCVATSRLTFRCRRRPSLRPP